MTSALYTSFWQYTFLFLLSIKLFLNWMELKNVMPHVSLPWTFKERSLLLSSTQSERGQGLKSAKAKGLKALMLRQKTCFEQIVNKKHIFDQTPFNPVEWLKKEKPWSLLQTVYFFVLLMIYQHIFNYLISALFICFWADRDSNYLESMSTLVAQ